jgi:High potential iron-sulfur protein
MEKTMQSSRRQFMRIVPIAIAGVSVASIAVAKDEAPKGPTILDPKDPAAVALGYITDSAVIEKLGDAQKAKYKAYVKGSECSKCALYQGAAGKPSGGCGIFPNKLVLSSGWCSAFNKKV